MKNTMNSQPIKQIEVRCCRVMLPEFRIRNFRGRQTQNWDGMVHAAAVLISQDPTLIVVPIFSPIRGSAHIELL